MMPSDTPVQIASALLVFAAGLCAAGLAMAAETSPAPAAAPTVEKQPFGVLPDGRAAELYTLRNARGTAVRVITYGATLIGVDLPDRTGKVANVTLYLEKLEDYVAGHPMLGSTVGRFANRIGGAAFTIDGKEYAVTKNAGANHIHGGKENFSRVIWTAQEVRGDGWAGVRLSYTSPDGEEGFPGKVEAAVTYILTAANELRMEYEATTDKPTHVNLTNHAYWNLAGTGDVLGHRLTLNADWYLDADKALIPFGTIPSVVGTPLDFRQTRAIGDRIADTGIGGYDHCYVITRREPGQFVLAARVQDPASGRIMEVFTTYPGVQLYTANRMNLKVKGTDRVYGNHAALCLETQFFPNTPNIGHFPTTILRPGETYRHVTVHKFGTE